MSRARNVADIMSGVGSNVVFEDGFGLDFGAVAGGGATGSVLDDYEEGTWTPDATSGGLEFFKDSVYVKIGPLVRISSGFRVSDQSSSNEVEISGLPFAPLYISTNVDTVENYDIGTFATERVNTGQSAWVYTATSNSLKFAKDPGNLNTNNPLLHSDCANAFHRFRISIWYYTTS